MNFVDYGTDEEDYEHINWTILDVNVMNISLGIIEGNYGAIDADDSSCHGYYIIKFSSSLYTLQAEFIIYGQVISSGGMVCEGNYFFMIDINYHYCVLQKNKYINTIVYISKIINGNVNVICYDSKYVLPPCLRYISQNNYNTLSPLQIPMKEHDNIMDENNQREII